MMRRPAAYAPLSVTFATGKTGSAIQDKHGLEGLAAWACLIAAAKRGAGQIVFAHDQDWQAIGVLRAPKFTLGTFLKTTGQLKQTRTTRQGHVLYVQLTRYGDWNDDARRERERERKSSKPAESKRKQSGSEAETNRKSFALELELELEEEQEKEPVPVPEPLLQNPAREAPPPNVEAALDYEPNGSGAGAAEIENTGESPSNLQQKLKAELDERSRAFQ